MVITCNLHWYANVSINWSAQARMGVHCNLHCVVVFVVCGGGGSVSIHVCVHVQCVCALGLSSLSFRRRVYLAQTVFKCLYSPCPSYLSQLLPSPSSSYHTQSSSSSQLNLSATKSCFGQRAFSFAGASMWRSICQTRDYQAFSAKCEDHLN